MVVGQRPGSPGSPSSRFSETLSRRRPPAGGTLAPAHATRLRSCGAPHDFEDGERDELDKWLTEHDCLGPGVWSIGDLVNGLGDMLLVTMSDGASAAPSSAEWQPCSADLGSDGGDDGAVAQRAAVPTGVRDKVYTAL